MVKDHLNIIGVLLVVFLCLNCSGGKSSDTTTKAEKESTLFNADPYLSTIDGDSTKVFVLKNTQ